MNHVFILLIALTVFSCILAGFLILGVIKAKKNAETDISLVACGDVRKPIPNKFAIKSNGKSTE